MSNTNCVEPQCLRSVTNIRDWKEILQDIELIYKHAVRLPCNHVMCGGCLYTFVTSKSVQVLSRTHCPEQHCTMPFPIILGNAIKNALKGSPIYAYFYRSMSQIRCPFTSCFSIIYPNEDNGSQQIIQCNRCKKDICKACRGPSHQSLGMNFDQDACRVVKYRIAELCGYYVLLRPGQLFTPCPCCQSLVSLTVDRRAICTCGLTICVRCGKMRPNSDELPNTYCDCRHDNVPRKDKFYERWSTHIKVFFKSAEYFVTVFDVDRTGSDPFMPGEEKVYFQWEMYYTKPHDELHRLAMRYSASYNLLADKFISAPVSPRQCMTPSSDAFTVGSVETRSRASSITTHGTSIVVKIARNESAQVMLGAEEATSSKTGASEASAPRVDIIKLAVPPKVKPAHVRKSSRDAPIIWKTIVTAEVVSALMLLANMFPAKVDPFTQMIAQSKCPYCRQFFKKGAKKLASHLSYEPMHPSFMCCNRFFATMALWNEHLSIHGLYHDARKGLIELDEAASSTSTLVYTREETGSLSTLNDSRRSSVATSLSSVTTLQSGQVSQQPAWDRPTHTVAQNTTSFTIDKPIIVRIPKSSIASDMQQAHSAATTSTSSQQAASVASQAASVSSQASRISETIKPTLMTPAQNTTPMQKTTPIQKTTSIQQAILSTSEARYTNTSSTATQVSPTVTKTMPVSATTTITITTTTAAAAAAAAVRATTTKTTSSSSSATATKTTTKTTSLPLTTAAIASSLQTSRATTTAQTRRSSTTVEPLWSTLVSESGASSSTTRPVSTISTQPSKYTSTNINRSVFTISTPKTTTTTTTTRPTSTTTPQRSATTTTRPIPTTSSQTSSATISTSQTARTSTASSSLRMSYTSAATRPVSTTAFQIPHTTINTSQSTRTTTNSSSRTSYPPPTRPISTPLTTSQTSRTSTTTPLRPNSNTTPPSLPPRPSSTSQSRASSSYTSIQSYTTSHERPTPKRSSTEASSGQGVLSSIASFFVSGLGHQKNKWDGYFGCCHGIYSLQELHKHWDRHCNASKHKLSPEYAFYLSKASEFYSSIPDTDRANYEATWIKERKRWEEANKPGACIIA